MMQQVLTHQSISQGCHIISCTEGSGIDALLSEIETHVQSTFKTTAGDSGPVITRARHRYHLEQAREALARFIEGVQTQSLPLDFATEDIRRATADIGAITGQVGVEELLDKIFSEFCIGK
mmetsp:Transcript_20410/g.54442  ORF Transcript_20410/g.54442 Transcript_20410/m.54442 type:complete len:121 (-) Transcript_20410:2338-2700(-)